MTLRRRLHTALAEAARVQKSDRPWQLPVAAAVSSGLPLLVGAAFGHIALGLAASLGGLVFLYMPQATLGRRLDVVVSCALGMVVSYTLGVLSHLQPHMAIFTVGIVTAAASMLCRLHGAPPPAALFFAMATSLAAYTPSAATHAALNIGLFAAGCANALAVTLVYGLLVEQGGRKLPPRRPPFDFDTVVTDSVLIAAAVCLSLATAQALGFQRPYWAPISCLAVVQVPNVRAAWLRHFHRIAGTATGLLLFGAIAATPLDPWVLAAAVIALTFVAESLVVRHYGAAVVFITCLAMLLAEAALLPAPDMGAILQARLFDTVLGATWGMAGAVLIHHPRYRAAVGGALRAVLGLR